MHELGVNGGELRVRSRGNRPSFGQSWYSTNRKSASRPRESDEDRRRNV